MVGNFRHRLARSICYSIHFLGTRFFQSPVANAFQRLSFCPRPLSIGHLADAAIQDNHRLKWAITTSRGSNCWHWTAPWFCKSGNPLHLHNSKFCSTVLHCSHIRGKPYHCLNLSDTLTPALGRTRARMRPNTLPGTLRRPLLAAKQPVSRFHLTPCNTAAAQLLLELTIEQQTENIRFKCEYFLAVVRSSNP